MITIDKNFYSVLLDNVSDMIFVMKVTKDNDFVYEYLNNKAQSLSTYQIDIVGHTIRDVNPEGTAILLYDRYFDTLTTKEVTTYQDVYISTTNKTMYSDTTLIPLLDDQQNCTHIIAVVKDITSKVEISQKLEESKEQLEIIVDNMADVVVLINSEKDIIFISPSYTKVLGITRNEIIGKKFTYNIHPDDSRLVKQNLSDAIEQETTFTVEFRQLNDKNEWIWLQAYGKPVLNKYKEFKHMVIVTRNINSQKEYQQKLHHLAMHDTLTNLPNRRHFNEQLSNALSHAQKNSANLALLLLDIDSFKSINDNFGHDIGDKVIQEFGQRLQRVCYSNYTAARLGGDEFAILLPNTNDKQTAINLVEDIRKIMSQPWDNDGTLPIITVSIGISIPNCIENMTEHSILKTADIALYEAKNAGKNMYKVKFPIEDTS